MKITLQQLRESFWLVYEGDPNAQISPLGKLCSASFPAAAFKLNYQLVKILEQASKAWGTIEQARLKLVAAFDAEHAEAAKEHADLPKDWRMIPDRIIEFERQFAELSQDEVELYGQPIALEQLELAKNMPELTPTELMAIQWLIAEPEVTAETPKAMAAAG